MFLGELYIIRVNICTIKHNSAKIQLKMDHMYILMSYTIGKIFQKVPPQVWSRQKPSKAVKNRRKAVKSQRKPSDGFLREVTAFDDSTPGKKFFAVSFMTNHLILEFEIFFTDIKITRDHMAKWPRINPCHLVYSSTMLSVFIPINNL